MRFQDFKFVVASRMPCELEICFAGARFSPIQPQTKGYHPSKLIVHYRFSNYTNVQRFPLGMHNIHGIKSSQPTAVVPTLAVGLTSDSLDTHHSEYPT
jgi:hypothetical protein